jgi:hypothetical protein
VPVRSGNHFEMKTEGGKQLWYWEDAVGSQCGRARKWRYEVQQGDSVREMGTCPQGYAWSEMTISGTPTQIS